MESSNNLGHTFAVWFKMTEDVNVNTKIIDQSEYNSMVKEVCDFKTIDEFWEVFQYLKKPDSSKVGLEISIFKKNIKPMWEDEGNKVGGKLTLKLKREASSPVWDELVYRFVGNDFPSVSNEDLNGIIYSSKKDMIVIQIWFKNYNTNFNTLFTGSIRTLFGLPESHDLELRQFNKPKGNNYSGNYSRKQHESSYK